MAVGGDFFVAVGGGHVGFVATDEDRGDGFVTVVGTDDFVIGFRGSSVGSSGDSGSGFVVDFLGLGGSHCVVFLGGATGGGFVVTVGANGDGCDGSVSNYPWLDPRAQEWLGFRLVQVFSLIV